MLLRSARVGAARCFESKIIQDFALIPPLIFCRAYTARIEHDFAQQVPPVVSHFALWLGVRVRQCAAVAGAGVAGHGPGRR